jgi:hypothetical protein
LERRSRSLTILTILSQNPLHKATRLAEKIQRVVLIARRSRIDGSERRTYK